MTWWTLEALPPTDPRQPGIYEWRIGDESIYVGQSKHPARRISEYPNNVRKLVSGSPYRRGNENGYRVIHHELRRAHDQHMPVTVAVLENCEATDLNERERHWITIRSAEAAKGGPRVLNATQGDQVANFAEQLYCWRCRVEMPMLTEQRWRQMGPLISDPSKKQQALDLYFDLTGVRETNPNAIWHHRRALYGPLCEDCGRPLRTPRAKFCADCPPTINPRDLRR